ncbi:MAG: hypothetical protein ABI439_13065 [Rhodospirillales bacterium]
MLEEAAHAATSSTGGAVAAVAAMAELAAMPTVFVPGAALFGMRLPVSEMSSKHTNLDRVSI